MTDNEIKGLFKQLMQQTRRKVVDSLLAGNDTCCFTTQQYAERWSKVSGGHDSAWKVKMLMTWPAKEGEPENLAHWHLSSYTSLIEVKPDVWTERLPELTEAERSAMNSLPPDFIERIIRGERPLGKPDWVEE